MENENFRMSSAIGEKREKLISVLENLSELVRKEKLADHEVENLLCLLTENKKLEGEIVENLIFGSNREILHKQKKIIQLDCCVKKKRRKKTEEEKITHIFFSTKISEEEKDPNFIQRIFGI